MIDKKIAAICVYIHINIVELIILKFRNLFTLL